MTILFDTDILAPVWCGRAIGTGIYYSAYHILLEMLKLEDLEVIVFSGTGQTGRLIYALKKRSLSSLKIWPTDIFSRGITCCEYYRFKSFEKYRKQFWPRFKRAIVKILMQKPLEKLESYKQRWFNTTNSFDIYFSPMYKIPDYIEKNKHIKKYVMLYDPVPLAMDDNIASFEDSWFMQLVHQVNKDDYYFTISDFAKNEFIRHIPALGEAQITVTHLAAGSCFDSDRNAWRNRAVREKYGIPQDKRYFLSLCTIEPRKNLVFAVKNFITFIKDNNITDLVFVLAGGHWAQFSAEISREISDFDNQNSIIIQTGYVDEEDLSPLYSNAECFVYVSKYEGFGLPPLEAMKCGTPVITSNAASLPEVVGDAGIMVDPYDDSALVKSYEDIYSDGELRKELSKKGIERAKQFSWKKCVDTMIEKFKE